MAATTKADDPKPKILEVVPAAGANKKKSNAYQTYMKAALNDLKISSPSITHKERFLLAAKNWKTDPLVLIDCISHFHVTLHVTLGDSVLKPSSRLTLTQLEPSTRESLRSIGRVNLYHILQNEIMLIENRMTVL
ncbi:uncharacterized protein MELLADRAFT_67852 [Melampsora larici-populina 98AG31]|uniref:YABBY protein C-terminal domain-containing protein n=1 Tax=Melampsora larici-populina (strain 98AG31 / pathotype 3-4-7) TaxID=747676 RepID=F4S4P5_MELLP|nr:uncharacterized protein MELLADRAFT_67852 [Melampsora larici-populina 98AG31]EGG00324.1 hypothetical protein MELLADRAFT_67852 [Melampsora larici-populina 98AG31]